MVIRPISRRRQFSLAGSAEEDAHSVRGDRAIAVVRAGDEWNPDSLNRLVAGNGFKEPTI